MPTANIKISKDMTIEEVIAKYPKTSSVFLKHDFHCLGCPAAKLENIEQGAQMHGIDLDKLIKELNEVIENGK